LNLGRGSDEKFLSSWKGNYSVTGPIVKEDSGRIAGIYEKVIKSRLTWRPF